MGRSFWDDEQNVERLKEYWSEGLSGSQIVRAFEHKVSRCAILGKVARLGLAARATAYRTPRVYNPNAPRKPKLMVVKEPPVIEEPPVTLENGSHVTLMTITDRMCRWPIGDPAASDFHFCGRSPRAGAPYCEAHCRKAYQPQMTIVSRKKAAAVEAAMADASAYKSMRRMFG